MTHKEQLPHYLQEIVAGYFEKNIEFPLGVLVTVTKVEVSEDRRHAIVWVSVLPDQQAEKCVGILKHNLYGIQGEVNRKITTRPQPRIGIKVDGGPAYSTHIEELLKKIDE